MLTFTLLFTVMIRQMSCFEVREASEALYNSMSGWGTDERALTTVLVNHNLNERLKIQEYFNQNYGDSLESWIRDETSRSYETALLSLLLDPVRLRAFFLNEAMAGSGTDERLLYVVLSDVPAGKMEDLRRVYEQEYGNSLRADLQHDLSGPLLDFLQTMANSNRQEEGWVDENLAKKDAMDLAGRLSFSKPSVIFHNVLSTRSFQQLSETIAIFHNITHTHLINFIRNKFKGDDQEALVYMVEYVINPLGALSELLYDSLTYSYDTDMITWILVHQSQNGLGKLSEKYGQMHVRSLEEDITRNTDGDYRYLLLQLLKLHS